MGDNGSFGSIKDLSESNTKRGPLGKYWCMTLNNWKMDQLEHIIKICVQNKYLYVIGEEIGEECGTPHLQGFVKNELKRFRAGEKFGIKQIHWDKTYASEEHNVKYCIKDKKYHTNMNLKKIITRDPLEGLVLYKYQKDILQIIEGDPDDRKIFWYWEKNGKTGKTTLAKHICMKGQALYVCGKAADIKFAFVKWIEKKKYAPEVVIFGIPRDKEEYMSYSALEEIKDGIFFSTKFESEMVIYNTPHVIIFANFPPEKEKISKDRWVINEIDIINKWAY